MNGLVITLKDGRALIVGDAKKEYEKAQKRYKGIVENLALCDEKSQRAFNAAKDKVEQARKRVLKYK